MKKYFVWKNMKIRFHSTQTTKSSMSPYKKAIISSGIAASVASICFILKVAFKPKDKMNVLAEECVIPPKYPWSHNGMLSSFDHASIRRGYQVYKEICAACHSMKYLAYRHLVGVSHTAEEAKAEAETIEVEDGPDDFGNMFRRPGRLTDNFPAPYANDEAARAANSGALPPDLSFMAKAREHGEDYIFALITGYSDAPAGERISEGQHFNKYFPGNGIAMARNIYDGVVDYEDGTPTNASQIAKDVTTFLTWAASPEHDERKLLGMRAMVIAMMLMVTSLYAMRHPWSYLRSRRYIFKPPSDPNSMH